MCHTHLSSLIHQQLEDLLESSDDTENTKGFKDTTEVDMCSRSQVLSTSTNSSQDLICYEDMGIVDMPSRFRATSQLTSGSPSKSDKSEQDAVQIVEDVKNLEPESECVSDGSCVAISLDFECGSTKTAQDYEDLKDAKQELTQFENGAKGSIVEACFCIYVCKASLSAFAKIYCCQK